MLSQIVTASQKKRNTSVHPYAFTEHGIAMLASVLRSEKAVKMIIAIVRAFIAMRQIEVNYKDIAEHFTELCERIDEHHVLFNQIYNAIENLLDEKAEQKSWKTREELAFTNKQFSEYIREENQNK